MLETLGKWYYKVNFILKIKQNLSQIYPLIFALKKILILW